MAVTLTEKAASEVKKIIAEQNLPEGTVLRVGVQGGGCSGFSYSLNFDTATSETRPRGRRPRREARRRQEVRPLPRRHRRRFLRRPGEARVRLQQPQRREVCGCGQLVPGLTGPSPDGSRWCVGSKRSLATICFRSAPSPVASLASLAVDDALPPASGCGTGRRSAARPARPCRSSTGRRSRRCAG